MLNRWNCSMLLALSALACGGSKNVGSTGRPITAAVSGSGGTAAATTITLPNITLPQLTAGTGALLTCDPHAESANSCGSNTCPALPPGAGATCLVNCCTGDGHCGTRIADPRYDTLGCIAVASADSDPRCPSVSTFGITLAGCCDAQGQCGQVVGPACVAINAGKACNAADPVDAGM